MATWADIIMGGPCVAFFISFISLLIWGMWAMAFGIYNEMRRISRSTESNNSYMAYQPAAFARLQDDEFALVWYRIDQERRRREARHGGYGADNDKTSSSAQEMRQGEVPVQRPTIMLAQGYIE